MLRFLGMNSLLPLGQHSCHDGPDSLVRFFSGSYSKENIERAAFIKMDFNVGISFMKAGYKERHEIARIGLGCTKPQDTPL